MKPNEAKHVKTNYNMMLHGDHGTERANQHEKSAAHAFRILRKTEPYTWIEI